MTEQTPYDRVYSLEFTIPNSNNTKVTRITLDPEGFNHNIKAKIKESSNSSGASNDVHKLYLYNLSRDTRNILRTGKGGLILRAGYRLDLGNEGIDELPVIFQGDVVESLTKYQKDGSTVTTICCSNGYLPKREAVFSKSYSSGTLLRTILKDLLTTFKQPTHIALGDLTSLTLDSPRSFSGPSTEVLQDLVDEYSLSWFNAKEVNYIVPIKSKELASGRRQFTIPPSRIKGTVDLVTNQVNKKPGEENVTEINFTMFLYAGITLGSLVKLNFQDETGEDQEGTFIAEAITYTLDLYGDLWDTTITGRNKVD